MVQLLIVSPLITRQISLALRRAQGKRKRFLSGLAGISASIVFLLLSAEYNPRKVGYGLFLAVMAWGFLQATWTASTMAIGLFSEERRNQTLPLLFLAGANSAEIFISKTGGLFILALSRVMVVLPCVVVAIIMTRFRWELVGATTAMLLAWTILTAGVYIFGSLLFDEESSAKLFSDLLLALMALPAPGLILLNRVLTGPPLEPMLLALSPGYGPWLLASNLHAANTDQVQFCALMTFLYGALFLVGSIFILNRVWKAQTIGLETAPSVIRRVLHFLRARQRGMVRSLLEANPYAWLIAKDFRPVVLAWLALGFVIGAWLIGLWRWSRFWLLPINFWLTCLFLGEVVRWLIHYLAAKQIGEDRASGGLELLLTSKLSATEMISGQELVIRRYVRPLFVVLASIYLLFFFAGLFTRAWTREAFTTYVLVWLLVAGLGPWMAAHYWSSFWVSLHTGRPGYALRKRMLSHGGFLSLAIQLYWNLGIFVTFPHGTYTELLVVAVVFVVASIFYFFGSSESRGQSARLRSKIIAEMREVAEQPPPAPDDPRLKTWNPFESFYREKEEKILV